MIKTKTITEERKVIDTITCDVCGKECSDPFDMDEFMQIRKSYGYGSKFWGDMSEIAIDLCEECQFNLFKDIARNINILENGPQ